MWQHLLTVVLFMALGGMAWIAVAVVRDIIKERREWDNERKQEMKDFDE